jgi:hypothetical protein
VSKYQQNIDPQIFKPQSCNGQRPHKALAPWHQKHALFVLKDNTAVATAGTTIGGTHFAPVQRAPCISGAYGNTQGPTLIGLDNGKSIAKVFCFGAVANKTSGIVYHDLTGNYLFISLNGSV